MTKWCLNYDSGEYEHIDRNGFSVDRGEFVFNWDDSQYRQEEERRRQEEEEEERRRQEEEELRFWGDDDDNW